MTPQRKLNDKTNSPTGSNKIVSSKREFIFVDSSTLYTLTVHTTTRTSPPRPPDPGRVGRKCQGKRVGSVRDLTSRDKLW